MKLANNHTCTNCGSDKIRCHDYSNLYTSSKDEAIKNNYAFSIDDEVYMDLICDDCNSVYNLPFSIIEKIPRDLGDRITYLEKYLEELKLKKSLKDFVK